MRKLWYEEEEVLYVSRGEFELEMESDGELIGKLEENSSRIGYTHPLDLFIFTFDIGRERGGRMQATPTSHISPGTCNSG